MRRGGVCSGWARCPDLFLRENFFKQNATIMKANTKPNAARNRAKPKTTSGLSAIDWSDEREAVLTAAAKIAPMMDDDGDVVPEWRPGRRGREAEPRTEARVTATELSRWLGISISQIGQMRNQGKMEQGEDGLYDLRVEVGKYIAFLKERRGERAANSVEAETAYWKLQNLKQKNRDWRLQRDRLIATEIVRSLSARLSDLRTACRDCPEAVAAMDALIAAAGNVDVELTAMAVEGEDEEDET